MTRIEEMSVRLGIMILFPQLAARKSIEFEPLALLQFEATLQARIIEDYRGL